MVLGLDTGVLILASLIAVVALVAFVNGILIPEVGNWFLDAVVKMPKFDYRFQEGEEGNDNWTMYRNLRTVAFMIIAIALTWSAVILIGEEFEVFRKGEAFSMLSKGILIIILIFTFPPIWDLFASGMEGLAKYSLNPSNPNRAGDKVSELMQMIGGIVAPNVDWDAILQFLLNPNDALQTLFRDVFLAVFKAFIASMLVFLMFIIGTIRIVLTGVLAISLPIILAISLLPFFDRVMSRLKDVLIGLSIAPLLSALAVSAGLALINSTNFSPLQEWLAAIAVAFLSISFPVIVSPMLGSLVTSASTIFTGGMLAGTLFGGASMIGAATGAARAVSGVIQTGMPITPLVLAKAAVSGAGSGLLTGVSTGALYSVGEALKTTGFGRLAEPIQRLERIAAKRMEKAGLGTAESIISNYTGHVTEGLLPSLALQPVSNTEVSNNKGKALVFANEIQRLADQHRYAEIAELANEYLQFKSIHNKQEFGKAFASQIQAYSKNAIALPTLYTNLMDLKERGGVQSLSKDQLSSLVYDRDAMREVAMREYGIDIPNPEFEVSSYMQLPKQLEAISTHMYEPKHAIANAILQAEASPATNRPPQRKSGVLQAVIRKKLNDYWKAKGIDTTRSSHIIEEFSHTVARNIANQYKDKPQVIWTLIQDMPNSSLAEFIPSVEESRISDISNKILPRDQITSIFKKHEEHEEDFASFMTRLEGTSNSNK